MMATFLGLHFFFGKNELQTVQNEVLHLQIWPIDLYGMYLQGSGGFNITVSSTSFQKSSIRWPQQPPT